MPLARTIRVDPRDHWARPGSKLRGVLDVLWDGHWHTSSELHAAYNQGKPDNPAWTWDSAKAQLKAKAGERGGYLVSQSIPGRGESSHRLVRAEALELERHLARSHRALAERRKRVASSAGAVARRAEAEDPVGQGVLLGWDRLKP
jgi:hypothetical protein